MIWFVFTRRLAVLLLVVGIVAAPRAVLGDPVVATLAIGGMSWGAYLDVVSVALLGFIGVLGWVVARYSSTNLRAREGLTGAGIALSVAVGSLAVMVTSANLVGVALGWTLSGLAVTVVIARAGTEQAARAASLMRRHLVVGDVALWLGVGLAVAWFPSVDRARLDEVSAGWTTGTVAALLVVACVVRSGLVPAHRWLAETAEAPSPVSALLHAGVVNGAGVLGVLAWPVFRASPQVLVLLLVLGLASVVLGVWAGQVRTDVKGRLACSTTNQMGYMCVQLGLGLPAMALMHLLGHGAYKSWMFLRAGGAVERHRYTWTSQEGPARRFACAVSAGAVGAVLGFPAARELTTSLGVTAWVPVVLVLVAAALAGWAVAG
ncbi:MAG: proton-conducting transporter membrane subunit, partial [Ornithinibacter sp.]